MAISVVRRLIQATLGRFGYQIVRSVVRSSEAFAIQGELIVVPNPRIFDVGAYRGDVAIEYRSLFPQATLHCFEPCPGSFDLLKQRVGDDQLTLTYNLALSDKEEMLVLNANKSLATNSLLSTDERGASFWGAGLLETESQCAVQSTTLDALCGAKNISHIDILKLDVQGAELAVLSGASNMLQRKGISLVYTELILCPTYTGQYKLHECLELLDSYGYVLLNFFNPVFRGPRLIQVDAVFVSPDLEYRGNAGRVARDAEASCDVLPMKANDRI